MNVFVPVVDAGIGLAKTIDAVEKGDYKRAGESGYGAAKAVAGVLAVGIGAGVARGASRAPTGTIRNANWQPREIKNPACSIGCERAAVDINKLIGGDILRITPKGSAPTLGAYRGKNWGWAHHEVVVKEGRVYDAFTGGKGASIAEYKALWEYPDDIKFGF